MRTVQISITDVIAWYYFDRWNEENNHMKIFQNPKSNQYYISDNASFDTIYVSYYRP